MREWVPAEMLRPFACADNLLITAIGIGHDQRIRLHLAIETNEREALAIVRERGQALLQLDLHRRGADPQPRQAIDLSRVVSLRFRVTKIDVVAVRIERDAEIVSVARRDHLSIAVDVDLPQPEALFAILTSDVSDVFAVR